MAKNYDFSGYATRNDLKCSDGRIIRHNAFKDNDGQTVPLVWNHQHSEVDNVLGHALLENREDGVYAYCSFNDTEAGQIGKDLVKHGDVRSLSIYANHLKQVGADVIHGAIREVSLVLAGANPGAFIDSVIAHGEEVDEEAFICAMQEITLCHADSNEEDKDMAEEAKKNENSTEEMDGKTVKEVFDTLSEEQKTAVYAIVGQAVEDAKKDLSHSDKEDDEEDDDIDDEEDIEEDDTDEEDDEEEGSSSKKCNGGKKKMMKHNVFDNSQNEMNGSDTLSHSEQETIISDAKRYGSLKDSFLAHANEYGIEDIDYLFPDAKTLNSTPEFIKRDTDWVGVVMNGTKHSPFSRVKSVFANITEDEARAKGYIKGKLKKEEVFSLLKRSTDPQTIYKKQKLDRDDVVDITDFDVVAWLKSEMRIMLDEEIARAILIGDGRLVSDDDHIAEDHIRPIAKDAELYTIRKTIVANSDEAELAKSFIRTAIKSRKDYKGSGNPILFTTEDMLTDMLLIEDGIGHLLYANEAQLATTLRVSKIVTVPVMEGQKGPNNGDLLGIIVNLSDYNVGADKGGAVSMFDDFDIDYNQMKYLIETRCSGALIKPYSAIVIEKVAAPAAGGSNGG